MINPCPCRFADTTLQRWQRVAAQCSSSSVRTTAGLTVSHSDVDAFESLSNLEHVPRFVGDPMTPALRANDAQLHIRISRQPEQLVTCASSLGREAEEGDTAEGHRRLPRGRQRAGPHGGRHLGPARLRAHGRSTGRCTRCPCCNKLVSAPRWHHSPRHGRCMREGRAMCRTVPLLRAAVTLARSTAKPSMSLQERSRHRWRGGWAPAARRPWAVGWRTPCDTSAPASGTWPATGRSSATTTWCALNCARREGYRLCGWTGSLPATHNIDLFCAVWMLSATIASSDSHWRRRWWALAPLWRPSPHGSGLDSSVSPIRS